jgi:signal transduction histidine kinase
MEELPDPQVPAAKSLAADHSGGIWLAMRDGLARYRHGRIENFPFSHGQKSGVNQVTVNPDGSVLAATRLGLVEWREGNVQTLTVRNGLPCNDVYTSILDKQGALWLSAQCGLVMIASAELEKWRKNADAVVNVKIFDAFDGVRTGLSSFDPGVSRSPDGRLWFVNDNILQMIDPAHLAENAIPPPVHVEEIIADRKNYAPRDNMRLPALTRDLEIDYTALSFVVPQKVRFKYKLEGRDRDWQDPQTRRQAFYSDLRPGSYRFRVMACNNDGVWNEAGASLNFTLLPAFYQTNWFLLLCAAIGLFLLWSLYQLRLRQVARQFNLRLEERVGERARIARELHDTMLQSFQAVLLKLHVVSGQLSDRPEVQERLDTFVEQAQQAVNEGRDAVHGLRSSTVVTNDLARAIHALGVELTAAQGDSNSPGFRVQVEGTPRDLAPILRDDVYRIAGEAVRNAFQHAQAKRIEVEIWYDQRQLRLRVRDDGKGIDPKVLEAGARAGHYGLTGLHERAKLIGGKLTVRNQPGGGAEIELTIPASIVYASPGTLRAIFSRL